MSNLSQKKKREIRHRRVRAKISGTENKPRLSVFKSNRYIYAALIDDTTGKTLVSVSDQAGKAKTKAKTKTTKVDSALNIGKQLAEKAKAQKITEAVFDRSGYQYTGRVKSVAEGAREGGLKF